jgi:hypothetical protein
MLCQQMKRVCAHLLNRRSAGRVRRHPAGKQSLLGCGGKPAGCGVHGLDFVTQCAQCRDHLCSTGDGNIPLLAAAAE